MTRIKNLTPHPVVIFLEDGSTITIHPEGTVPRVRETARQVGFVEVKGKHVPLYEKKMEGTEGLPLAEPKTLYIVPLAIAMEVRSPDLVVPHDFVRDDQGRIIGCRALARIA